MSGQFKMVNGRMVMVDAFGKPMFNTVNNDIGSTQATTDTVMAQEFNGMPTTGGTSMFDNAMDWVGSQGGANTLNALGMGANAYMQYEQNQETKKQNKRMFDLEKGQVDRANAYQDSMQKNYLAGR